MRAFSKYFKRLDQNFRGVMLQSPSTIWDLHGEGESVGVLPGLE